MSRFATSQSDVSKSESVQGLVSYLEERWLERYVPAAEAWCSEMGAMHIDEVLDEVDAFAEALKLKPLELKRFLGKPRSPRTAPVLPRTPAPQDSDATSTAPSTIAASELDSDGFQTV